ncbi:DUF645 family protein, partial [Vibrio cholerae]|nr:DUF645 family protein [Vibrio cholerae]EKF9288582.1 DUF645 family protein [Vibrio cholerae]
MSSDVQHGLFCFTKGSIIAVIW